jgi:hypothetical protein
MAMASLAFGKECIAPVLKILLSGIEKNLFHFGRRWVSNNLALRGRQHSQAQTAGLWHESHGESKVPHRLQL